MKVKVSEQSIKHLVDNDCVDMVVEYIRKLEAENARLKAEVAELKSQPDPLTAYLYAAELAKDEVKRLKAKIERLQKLGTEMGKHLPDTDAANRAYIDFEAGGRQ